MEENTYSSAPAPVDTAQPSEHVEGSPLVMLGVSGCIAAYKACEVARGLVKAGCRVRVVMTENATRFVGPTTFRALTGEPVGVSLWEEPGSRVHHIALAEEADVFAVVPATANVVAKLAVGRADDLLTTIALATEAPLVVAPAMNVHMWRSATNAEHVCTLQSRGAVVVEPDSGELACGDVGEGRLAEPAAIVEAILAEARRSRDLTGVSVLVTAGPTHEPIDPVRFVGNASSGKTGYLIAEEAARRGASVVLVSGPSRLPDPFGVRTVRVTTALEMRDAVEARYAENDVVVATAAVSDFRPAEPSAEKVKKDAADLVIHLERNPDILAGLGERKDRRLLVGFAAETADPVGYASGKLGSKNLDLVVANDVTSGFGFGTDSNRVWFVQSQGAEEMPLMSKRAIARELWNRIARGAREAAVNRKEGTPR